MHACIKTAHAKSAMIVKIVKLSRIISHVKLISYNLSLLSVDYRLQFAYMDIANMHTAKNHFLNIFSWEANGKKIFPNFLRNIS